jgi:hypothetical protein
VPLLPRACHALLLTLAVGLAACGGSLSFGTPVFELTGQVIVADLDGDGRPEVLMPLAGSVLLWRRDPAQPDRLLRWRELGR